MGFSLSLIGIFFTFLTPSSGRKVSFLNLTLMALSGYCVVPFVYNLFYILFLYEFIFLVSGWVLMGLAFCIYKNHWFDFYPSIFGFHESFHFVELIASTCFAIYNYFVITRI